MIGRYLAGGARVHRLRGLSRLELYSMDWTESAPILIGSEGDAVAASTSFIIVSPQLGIRTCYDRAHRASEVLGHVL